MAEGKLIEKNCSGVWIYETDLSFSLPPSQYRIKPDPHPHQALMDEAKADPSIEWQYLGSSNTWRDCCGGCEWFRSSIYRKKPKPKTVDMWQWAYKTESGRIRSTDMFYLRGEDVTLAYRSSILCKIEGSKITVEEKA
jgi:hypothetical protein